MRITSGLTARHSRLSSKVLRIGADGNPERRAAMGVDPNIQQVVENSIGQILDALEAAGHVTIEKLDPENKERYSKEICGLGGDCCCQHACRREGDGATAPDT
jgi:hypothetical protein